MPKMMTSEQREELCLKVQLDPLAYLGEFPNYVFEILRLNELELQWYGAKVRVGPVCLISFGKDHAQALANLADTIRYVMSIFETFGDLMVAETIKREARQGSDVTWPKK